MGWEGTWERKGVDVREKGGGVQRSREKRGGKMRIMYRKERRETEREKEKMEEIKIESKEKRRELKRRKIRK